MLALAMFVFGLRFLLNEANRSTTRSDLRFLSIAMGVVDSRLPSDELFCGQRDGKKRKEQEHDIKVRDNNGGSLQHEASRKLLR